MTQRASLFRAVATAAVLCLSGGLPGASLPAAAATFADCEGDVLTGVSPNAGCTELIGVVNDDAAAMNMAPGAFGETTWEFIGRDNAQPETGDIGIFTGTDFITARFSFDGALTAGFSKVSLVLKSAASADPCAVIAYLLEDGQTSGTYDSPFLCRQGSQQELSHLTLYGIRGTAPVPLPAVGAGGLALALVLLGSAARRRG